MKKPVLKNKKLLIPALIALPVIAGATFAVVQLTDGPDSYTLDTRPPPTDPGSERNNGPIEETNPRPKIVVPVGPGIAGKVDPKKETTPEFYVPLRLPFVDDTSVNTGSGFILSSETLKENAKVTVTLQPRGSKDQTKDIALKVTNNDVTPEADRNVAVPSNIGVGLYTLTFSDSVKTYSANVTVIGSGDQMYSPPDAK